MKNKITMASLNFIKKIAVTLIFGSSPLVYAANNAAPFGFEIGEATLEQVKADIGAQIRLEAPQYAEIASHPECSASALKGSGPGYRLLGMQGLHQIIFCFENNNKLSRVQMKLVGITHEEMMANLNSKYKIISKEYGVNSFNKLQAKAVFQQKDSFVTYYLYDRDITLVYVTSKVYDSNMAIEATTAAAAAEYKKKSADMEADKKRVQSLKF